MRARVLIVDDEPTIRMVARLMLERAGYAVEEASDAAESLALVRAAEPFALILLDVTLPDRSGIEIIPDLRAAASWARIILTSGKAEEDVPDHGADSYLPKPFTKDQLVAAVRTATAVTAP
jgi:DNA-binding response OmpR family regulator